MKQDKQENNDDERSVVCSTIISPYLKYFNNLHLLNITVGGHIKGDTNDYEEMNKVIYL